MTRYSSLRPINRIKQVVDVEGGLVAGTQSNSAMITAVDSPVLANPGQIQTASKVNGFYLHLEVSHTSGTGRPNIYLIIYKNPGNNITAPAANAVGSDDNKRFVIHQEMLMMSGDAGNGLPRPLFNGVIVIPKGMRRFAPNDRLYISILSPNVAADFCMQMHFKEFR